MPYNVCMFQSRKMVAQYSWLVLLLINFLTNALLTVDNVELIYSLAAHLGFSCISVIVEDVDRINIKVRGKLTKHDFSTIITELEDLEKIFTLVGKDKTNAYTVMGTEG